MSNQSNPSVCIATHNGAFHADDVFGVTVLGHVLASQDVSFSLERTRDAQRIRDAQFAIDVGGEWDPARGRFDHHQHGFNGQRASGVVYASAGLIWREYGAAFVEAVARETAVLFHGLKFDAHALAQELDDELVQYLDLVDTGAAQPSPAAFGLSSVLASYNLTGVEERHLAQQAEGAAEVERVRHHRFMAAVAFTDGYVHRLVLEKLDALQGAASVREGERFEDGAILLLPCSGLSWFEVVCQEMPQVRFVVYPDSTDQQFQVRTVPVAPGSFTARMDLPRDWAGLRDGALAAVSGVPDAVFCHNNVFIAGAGSCEGALALARLALAQAQG